MHDFAGSYKIVAVVLHYNSPDLLLKVLDAIRAQTVKPSAIIVVDNASKTDLSENFKGTEIIFKRLNSNLGVGAGHNSGWKIAIEQYGADLIWSLEHDTIPKPDCLEKLIQHYKPNTLVALCPVDDNGLDFENKKYYIFHSTGFKRINDKRKNSLYKGGLSFNGLLLPVYIIQRIGYLNEEFFVGREDFDFYHRIYAERGYVLRVPEAQVYHNMYKETKKISVFNSVYLFPQQSEFREYYSYRNSVYTSKQKGVPLWKLYARHIVGLILTVLFRNSKLERLKNRRTAFRNGLQGLLGK